MGKKKRKTRQQKIIAKLKRELKKQQVVSVESIKSVPARQKPARDPRRNAGIKSLTSVKKEKTKHPEIKQRAEKAVFSYEPKLIKKDLIKTVLLSLVFLGLIFILKFSPLLELIFRQ